MGGWKIVDGESNKSNEFVNLNLFYYNAASLTNPYEWDEIVVSIFLPIRSACDEVPKFSECNDEVTSDVSSSNSSYEITLSLSLIHFFSSSVCMKILNRTSIQDEPKVFGDSVI